MAPPNGQACWPLVPLSPGDMHYVDQLIIRINRMIEDEALRNDAEFVDTYRDSGGHDVCKTPPERWFEGLVPTEPAYPLHPNAKGEASMARSGLAVLQNPPPVPVITRLRAPHRLRSGHAARVRFHLDRSARVRLVLRRRTHGRLRGVLATRFIAGQPGANRARLPGRLLRRRAGVYRLIAIPSTHTVTGAPRGATVRIRRPS